MTDLNQFKNTCKNIQNLPYKRNKDKSDVLCVLKDNGGTCSTKHAYLKHYADENGLENVKLMLGIFRMNAQNTKKISAVLEKFDLKEIPEAHNYLRINDEIHDYTRKNSKPEDFVSYLIEEIEIQPHQITEFKVKYHKNFLKKYLEENTEIPYSLAEFWKIREECIAVLQK